MANHSRPIVLSPGDRRELQRLQRSSSVPAGLSRRARAVLLIADHISGAEVARRTGYTQVQVSRIRRRFVESGLAGLPDRPRSGRPRRVKPRKTAQVVAMTLKPPPAGVTHWSSRDLAKKLGLSHTPCIASGRPIPSSPTGSKPSSSAPIPRPRRKSMTSPDFI